ncbi:MAG: hypothetical protein IAE93_12860 [Ignavibacteria bacterium]|nr:hypothetical protein [Ignavibacteria bacterium]
MTTTIKTPCHSDLCKAVLTPGMINAAYDTEQKTMFSVMEHEDLACCVECNREEQGTTSFTYIVGFPRANETDEKEHEVLDKMNKTITDNSDICSHCLHRFNFLITGECNNLYEDERTYPFYEVNIV